MHVSKTKFKKKKFSRVLGKQNIQAKEVYWDYSYEGFCSLPAKTPSSKV